jgi:hypothetical protein
VVTTVSELKALYAAAIQAKVVGFALCFEDHAPNRASRCELGGRGSRGLLGVSGGSSGAMAALQLPNPHAKQYNTRHVQQQQQQQQQQQDEDGEYVEEGARALLGEQLLAGGSETTVAAHTALPEPLGTSIGGRDATTTVCNRLPRSPTIAGSSGAKAEAMPQPPYGHGALCGVAVCLQGEEQKCHYVQLRPLPDHTTTTADGALHAGSELPAFGNMSNTEHDRRGGDRCYRPAAVLMIQHT